MNKKTLLTILPLAYTFSTLPTQAQNKPLNVLLITADDLNYSSVGFMGCPIPNTTPNIDKLATQGLIFTNSYNNIAVSQPSRAVMATGMYAHNNGVEGFFHTQKNIPTVMSVLGDNGYITGIAGKHKHSTPIESYKWDTELDMPELGEGRDPRLYYNSFNKFVSEAKTEGKPFYFMANSHDPHAPFHGSKREKRAFPNKTFPDASYVFTAEDITVVPDFLPDLQQTRNELAQYYSSIRRLDDTVGELLKVLEEQGVADNTIVMFLSDNGMDFPFAKTNCYMNSNKTPWIVRWPGVTKADSKDNRHFISTIDFMPTVLDACGIKFEGKTDGHSFVPILKGEKQKNRREVYTQFYETSALNSFPMFAIHDADFVYIYSPWAYDDKVFINCAWGGETFAAMRESNDPKIQQRYNFFRTRTQEELYDAKNDADGLVNLADDPKHKKTMERYHKKMEQWMISTGSWGIELFQNRDNDEFCKEFVNQKSIDSKKRAGRKL